VSELARPKVSRYAIASDAFLEPGRDAPIRILFSTRTGERHAIEDSTWTALSADPGAAIPAGVRSALERSKLLVPDDEDELGAILAENQQARESHPVLTQVIQPTAACQLACDYCGQAHSPRKLSSETLDGLLDQLDRKLATGRFRALDIGWFGGEPLLAQDVMRVASPRLRALAERRRVEYVARLVTNGILLTSGCQDELYELHRIAFVEVTLDGDQARHDTRRLWKRTGHGSFAAILENVISLVARPQPRPEVSVRCNVDARNVEGVIPLIRQLAEAGLHRKLEFYVAPVHSWGNGASRLSLPAVDFASWEIVWFAEMARLGYPLSLIPGRTRIACLTFKPGSELMDATGARFNCTEVSYVPSYTVNGQNVYQLGTDGTPTGRAAVLASFQERLAAGEYPCRECSMLPTCGGSCAKAWIEGDTPCPPEKHNIGARLILDHVLKRMTIKSFEVRGEANPAPPNDMSRRPAP
jgi:uncharacterized protein